MKIDLSEGKGEEEEEDEEREGGHAGVADLRAFLQAVDVSKLSTLLVCDFEKDDDSNHHIDIVRAATNLRGFNYAIKS